MGIKEAILRFLEYCELDRNLSLKTVRMYGYYLQFFQYWLLAKYQMSNIKYQNDIAKIKNELQDKDFEVEKINEEIIREFRLYLSHQYKNKFKGELKRQTQNYFLVALRSLFRFLLRQGFKVISPEMIELGKLRDRNIKFLLPEELEKIFAAVDTKEIIGLRDRAILEVLFFNRSRVSS